MVLNGDVSTDLNFCAKPELVDHENRVKPLWDRIRVYTSKTGGVSPREPSETARKITDCENPSTGR